MRRKLLLAVVTLIAAVFMGGSSLKAQVWFETDLTKDFVDITDVKNWTAGEGTANKNPGYAGWAAPAVTIAGVPDYRLIENYGEGESHKQLTGDVMYATVTGLQNGTYTIELFGAACLTEGRAGMSTDFEEGDENSQTAAYLYATPGGGTTVKQYISCLIESNMNYRGGEEGIPTARLENVVVTDGTIKIGLYKEKGLTNWHFVQLKSVIATVDAVALYESSLSNAQGLETAKMSPDALTTLTTALSTYGNLGTSATVDEYRAAIDALDDAAEQAEASVAVYAKLKAVIDANAAYAGTFTEDAQNMYATAVADVIAAYDNATVTDVDGNIATLNDALYQACKSQEQPTDGSYMTAWITNPSFEEGTIVGWEGNMKTIDNDSFEKDGLYFAEFWEPYGMCTLYQTDINLPPGNYELSATVKARDVTSATLYATDAASGKRFEYEIPVQDETARYVVPFVCLGMATIGFEGVGNLTVGSWLAIDDFQLTYISQIDVDQTRSMYEEALAAAKAVEEEGLPAGAYNALQDVITANTLSDGTADQYSAAAQALLAATVSTEEFRAPYVAWKDLKVQAEALAAVSNNNASANQTLRAAISDQNDAVEGATAVDELETATSTLKDEMVYYVSVAEPTNDECFDLTFMIVNPHFTEGDTYEATGWTRESGAITEHRVETHNFESWHNYFNLSQKIPNLPKGTYKVTLQGFASHDGVETNKTVLYCGVATQEIKDITSEYSETPLFYSPMEGTYCPLWGGSMELNYDKAYDLNGTPVYRPAGMTGSYYYFKEINPMTGQPFYFNEVNTVVPEAGDLKIGFKCETDLDWVIWDNFHLYYYGSAIEVTIDEGMTKTFSEDIENANVTLNRTIKAGLNSVVFPFDMTQAEVEEYFGDKSTVYGVNDFDDVTSTVSFVVKDGIQANVPCILQATVAGTSYKIDGRTLKAGEPVREFGNLQFIGSYEASTTIASKEGNFILYDGKLLAVDSDNPEDVVTLKGTRAYFKVVDGAAAGSRVLSMNFDGGEADDIDEVDSEKVADGIIYNLAGQPVGPDYKGVAIINGKTVLLK